MRRYYSDPAFRDFVKTRTKMRSPRYLGIEGITDGIGLCTFLLIRDDGICGICGKQVTEEQVQSLRHPMRPSPDHIIPLSRGGSHAIDNLQLSHLRCNLSKGARGKYDPQEDMYEQEILNDLRMFNGLPIVSR